jgi:uncharacterized protein (TIGR02421 family)
MIQSRKYIKSSITPIYMTQEQNPQLPTLKSEKNVSKSSKSMSKSQSTNVQKKQKNSSSTKSNIKESENTKKTLNQETLKQENLSQNSSSADRLQKIDAFFNHISAHLSFSAINPSNAAQIDLKILKSKKNITFEYEQLPELAGLISLLEVIEFTHSPFEQIFAKKRDELILKLRLLESRGTVSFSKTSSQLYARPSKQLLKIAQIILETLPNNKNERAKLQKLKSIISAKILTSQTDVKYLTRKEAKKFLENCLSSLGLDWSVKIRKQIVSAEVDVAKKTIFLESKDRFLENYIHRLAIHEIGTHVLRAENGALQKYNIFLHGFAQYLETEEGLAAYNEYTHSVMTNAILRNYAGRVLAIDYAMTHSFYETYEYLSTFFTQSAALKLTLRVKRGLVDMYSHGAYTKDASYLRGFLAVLEFAKKHNSDVSALYIGKIGIADLEGLSLIKTEYSIIEPKYLPKDLTMHIDKNSDSVSAEFVESLLKEY